jgi:hypothetical protein
VEIQTMSPQSAPGIGGAQPTAMTASGATPLLRSALTGIAQQLGMSVEDVQASLKQGVSIGSLAEQRGVSRSAVAGTLEQQIQQARKSAGQGPLDQTTLERIVGRALDRGRQPAAPGASPLSSYGGGGVSSESSESPDAPAGFSIYA